MRGGRAPSAERQPRGAGVVKHYSSCCAAIDEIYCMTMTTSEPILERLAGRVRARRKELSLTLRELSASADVSERFLVLLEGGRANVSVTRLEDIARALGTTAAELLSDRPLDAAA